MRCSSLWAVVSAWGRPNKLDSCRRMVVSGRSANGRDALHSTRLRLSSCSTKSFTTTAGRGDAQQRHLNSSSQVPCSPPMPHAGKRNTLHFKTHTHPIPERSKERNEAGGGQGYRLNSPSPPPATPPPTGLNGSHSDDAARPTIPCGASGKSEYTSLACRNKLPISGAD